jgi:glucokinase
MSSSDPLILAADIGGTNTRVALLDGTRLRKDTIKRFENAKSDCLEDILAQYLSTANAQPDAVSLALAGPVNGSTGKLTNRNWDISTDAASKVTGGAKTVLLNDLQAQGCSLPFVAPDSIAEILPGRPAPNDLLDRPSCLVIGLGTGMNISPVHYSGNLVIVPPSEAGHISFASQVPDLSNLGDWMTQRYGHVSTEDILSGRGVENCYEYATGLRIPASEVLKNCEAGDPNAETAVSLMVRTLGHFAGDMALINMPRGGVYLIGGVARALHPYLHRFGFAESFADKGRFGSFMTQFPVRILQDDYAALMGAASYAAQRIR